MFDEMISVFAAGKRILILTVRSMYREGRLGVYLHDGGQNELGLISAQGSPTSKPRSGYARCSPDKQDLRPHSGQHS